MTHRGSECEALSLPRAYQSESTGRRDLRMLNWRIRYLLSEPQGRRIKVNRRMDSGRREGQAFS
jgi:hypothetical protein